MSRKRGKRGESLPRHAGDSKPAAPGWLQTHLDLLGLVLILGIAAWVHSIYGGAIDVGPDDVLLMEGSRKIGAGAWRQIWAPQHAHFVPLYRLVRLPFDLHFPAWYVYFHVVVVGAHLASAVLLYLLARRYLESRCAALLVAALFAWSTVGYEALEWKAGAPFALSWTFLLLCAWCLTRAGPAWTAAATASLACAVGFFSGALFAIPGLFLWTWLLEPHSRRRVLGICVGVGLAGSAAWLVCVLTALDFHHYWSFGDSHAGPVTRLLWAFGDTWNAYVYQLGMGLGSPELRYAFLLLAALCFVLLRERLNTRWVLSVFAFTVLPLFVILLIRRAPEIWKVSRYGYQSYVFWVVVLGALADALLLKLGPGRMKRAIALAAMAVFAGYYAVQNANEATAVAQRLQPESQRRFWFGWHSFFRLASEHRTQAGGALRVPSLEILPGLNLQAIYALCYPRGLPGISVEPGAVASAEQQDEFWREIEYARPQIPWLPRPARAPGHAPPRAGS